MKLPAIKTTLGRFLRNDQGNIAILFGLMLVPLALAVGVGLDYETAQHFRVILQGDADAAALAGASAYTDASSADAAKAVATNYMNRSISDLPPNNNLSFTVTTGVDSAADSTVGYTVTVNVGAKVATTLMQLASTKALTIAVGAVAENPVVTATVNLNGFSSSACDANTIYWYPIPTGDSPASYIPPASALTSMWTNIIANPPPPAPISLASASQQIGFALKNVTGQLCRYGSNQYGGLPGSTHMFYSNLVPPSQSAYPSVAVNSSLQVVPLSSGETQAQIVNALPHTTFLTSPPLAAPSCGGLKGQTMVYAWNDMGAPTDDLDYNDAAYTFSCTGPGGSGPNVRLIQ